MYRITIDILDPNTLGPIAAKETIAMALELFGPVRAVQVLDSEAKARAKSGSAFSAAEQLRI